MDTKGYVYNQSTTWGIAQTAYETLTFKSKPWMKFLSISVSNSYTQIGIYAEYKVIICPKLLLPSLLDDF